MTSGMSHPPLALAWSARVTRACMPAALAAVVLFANFALVWHQYDLARHAGGDYCATCVAAHALDHSIATAIMCCMAPIVADLQPPPAITPQFSQTTHTYLARAPPEPSPSLI